MKTQGSVSKGEKSPQSGGCGSLWRIFRLLTTAGTESK